MTSQPVQTYDIPGSYYSQRVRLALEEKGIEYASTFINIKRNAQITPWYLRRNPQGLVPMLRIGDEYISESEAIIDVVDKLNNDPVLIPDPNTTEGRLVKEWRTRLFDINVEGITYGVVLNPELRAGPLKVPSAMITTKEVYQKRIDKSVQVMEALKEKCPDLREILDKKIDRAKKKPLMMEKSITVRLLEELEGILDVVEAQLRKSRTENIAEHWLCGPNFTVADISLCVLLGRLEAVGLDERYIIPEKRPALVEYWNQAKRRPSVVKIVLSAMKNTVQLFMKEMLTKVAAGAVVTGGVVALGAFLVHKYMT